MELYYIPPSQGDEHPRLVVRDVTRTPEEQARQIAAHQPGRVEVRDCFGRVTLSLTHGRDGAYDAALTAR